MVKEIFSASDVADYFKSKKDELLAAWREVEVDGYASDYQNIVGPFAKMVYKGMDRFKGRTVLDIGCNSGQNSIAVSFFAKEVIGCEVQNGPYMRALRSRDIVSNDFPMDHVSIEKADVREALNDRFDAILACKVLYWVGDDNVRRIRDFLKGKSDFRILIHTVPGREPVTTKIYNGMFEVNDIKSFLRDAGFETFEEWGFKSSSGHIQTCIFSEKFRN
ncbi:MAG: class I SAM-dependent methyltransferase [Pararhodobacter sp.]|nr:class I SAM-dependent methyltransferase [Pararhodobacter sp.]